MKLRKFFWLSVPVIFMVAVGVLALSARASILEKGCECSNLKTTDGQLLPNEKEAYFEGRPVETYLAYLNSLASYSRPEEREVVLGVNNEEKWIEIDLSEQKLKAWEGNQLYLETLISSGKSWTPTVTGEFRIWAKFQYAKMSGGIKGTNNYYYLPNVPYIMYFKGDYALHGAYWHANFGHPMSHGCVNLPIPVAAQLYYWSAPVVPSEKRSTLATADNPGTRVVIHE